jgi:two-component system sensor histidine kinase/response regulator
MIISSVSEPANLGKVIAELDIRAFMLKPVRPSDLIECIMEMLGVRSNAVTPSHENEETRPIEPIISAQGAPLRVLLAEDNTANQEVALWQLEKLGCIAEPVKNGLEVLEAIARNSYDVILMDCRMPKMDGYEATRKVRLQEGPARHTPIITMTAHAWSGDQDKCLAAGMDDYISKPVALKTLSAVLRRVTGAVRVMPPAAASAPEEQANDAQRPAVESTPEAPALEPGTMASLHAKGDLLPKLIDATLGEMPEQLKQLAEALERHAYADAAITAHSLKGTARIFGAAHMADIAASLEQAADAEAGEKAVAELGRLKAECDRVRRELEREKEKSAPDIN